MAYENFWPQVSTALSGTTTGGIITVTSTAGFYVRQNVIVSQAASNTSGVVKEILSSTQMRIGAPGGTYPGVAYDMSGYGAGASVFSPYQQIRYHDQSNPIKDVYECEPVKALRVMTVDQVGNYVAGVGGGGASSTVSVNNFPATQPVSLATTAAGFQYIKVVAATLTLSNTSSATAFNAGTMSSAARIFSAVSNLDQAVGITLNGAQIHELNQGEAFSFDLAANARQINASTTIGLFNISASSSSGSIRFNIIS